MDRAQENAIEIAKWLKEQDIVKKVVYPGFKEHPGYEIMKKQARGFGAMLTFELTKKEYAIKMCIRDRIISATNDKIQNYLENVDKTFVLSLIHISRRNTIFQRQMTTSTYIKTTSRNV